jgi:nicotinamide riboside kinase
MLIGIGGSTLSGKTTTAHHLFKVLNSRGYHVAIIPEFTTEVAKELGYHRIDDIRKDPHEYFKFELEILSRKIQAETELSERYDYVICDTTTAEVILYSQQYLPPSLSQTIVKPAKNNLSRYDVIFLLEPLNVPSNNGFRSRRDIIERRKHHEILKRIYPKYVEIPPLTVQEGVELILSYLL